MDEETDPLAPPFATKVAIVIRDDLEPWPGLNVTAFLVSGITAAHPELVGRLTRTPTVSSTLTS